MPCVNGLKVTRQISRRRLNTRAIILSMYSGEHYVLSALRGGAFGYVPKAAAFGQLVRAVRDVVAGVRYPPPPYSESAVEAYLERTKGSTADAHET